MPFLDGIVCHAACLCVFSEEEMNPLHERPFRNERKRLLGSQGRPINQPGTHSTAQLYLAYTELYIFNFRCGRNLHRICTKTLFVFYCKRRIKSNCQRSMTKSILHFEASFHPWCQRKNKKFNEPRLLYLQVYLFKKKSFLPVMYNCTTT